MASKTVQTVTGSGVCKCGSCGEIVRSMGKSLYRPGHDARHVGAIARYIAETGDANKIQELPSDALRRKAQAMVQRLQAKAQATAERKSRETKTTTWTEGAPVKVGRWTYPTRSNGKTTQRNEKRDGTGAWTTI